MSHSVAGTPSSPVTCNQGSMEVTHLSPSTVPGDSLQDVAELTLPHRVPEPEDQRNSLSERTEQSSDASIHAPDENEHWNWFKNCRLRRRGNIPGWFDRWKLGSPNWMPVLRSIDWLAAAHLKAYYRRRLLFGFALQMTTITTGTSVLLFVPGLAEAAQTSFLANSDSTIGLFVAMISTIPVLKLVFDINAMRRLIFAFYTSLIILATTSAAILSEIETMKVAIALGAITLETWIQWLLSGVQINGYFLGCHIIFVIPAILLPLATMGLTTALGDDSAFSATVVILHSILFGVYKAFTIARLLDTVLPQDASLGVYLFTFDLLPGLLLLPLRVGWDVTLSCCFLTLWCCVYIYCELCCYCRADVDCHLRAPHQSLEAVQPIAPPEAPATQTIDR